MANVYAFCNGGDWGVICPRCGNAVKSRIGINKVICIVCWPGIMATALQEVTTVTNGITQKILRPVPDLAARQEATIAARQEQEEYNVMFPPNVQAIADIINAEPDINWKNWYPDRDEVKAKTKGNAYGQSLADMQHEHDHHGARP